MIRPLDRLALLSNLVLALVIALLIPALSRSLSWNFQSICAVKEGLSGSAVGSRDCGSTVGPSAEPHALPGGGPNAEQPAYLITKLLSAEGLWESAQSGQALKIWRQLPDADVYYSNRSDEAAVRGELDEAMRLAGMAQAIEPRADPNKSPMYRSLCQAWRDQGRFAVASPWCTAVLEASGDGWPLIQLAIAQYEAGDYGGATASLRSVLRSADEASQGAAYHQLGRVYLASGQLDQSVGALRSALEAGVSGHWIYLELASALFKSGKLQEACREIPNVLKSTDADQLAVQRLRENFQSWGCPGSKAPIGP